MSLLGYAFLGFFIAGSVTIGYLLLRLTFPDIRLLTTEVKLGSAGISGALLTISAFIVDYLFEGSLNVLEGTGTYPIILFLLFALSFVFMKLYFIFSRPEYLTVGVPIANPITIRIEKSQAKEEPKEREVREKIIGWKSVNNETRADSKKEVIKKLRADTLEAVSDEKVELQKKENFFSKVFHLISLDKNPKKVNLDENKKTTVVTILPAPVKVENQKAEVDSKNNEKNINLPITPPIAPQNAQKSAGYDAKERSGEPAIIPLGGSKSEFPKPAMPRKSFMAMVGGIVEKDGKPDWEGKNQSNGGGVQSAIELSNQMPNPADENKDAQNNQSKSPFRPTAQNQIKTMDEHERISKLREEMARESTEIRIPQKPKEDAGQFKTDPKMLKEEVLHAEEMQADLILEDILPKEIKEVKEPSKPTQIDSHQHRMYQIVQQQGIPSGQVEIKPGGIVHRRYMMKSDDQVLSNSGVSVIANSQTMSNENFDSLVNDVYSQLKTSKRTDLKTNLSVAPPKDATSKPAQTNRAELTFDDLLSDKKPPADAGVAGGMVGGLGGANSGPAGAPQSIMDQLANLGPITSPKPEMNSSIDFVKIQAEKGMGCPTCHNKSSKIIFCPYCGSGMCANCSPSIKIKEGGFVYTCPKCKEDVDVKKKAPEPETKPAGLMG